MHLLSVRPYSAKTSNSHQAWKRPSTAILAAAATLVVVYGATQSNRVEAEAPPTDPQQLTFEKSKKRKGASKEEIRDLISSQHLQVKRSWENPGVYAWGSNTGKVAAPDSNETYIKTPRRIPYFDDVLLRDLKLDRTFGAAVLENGDLVQWGKAYSEDVVQPTVTLKGKDLKSIVTSRDRIIGLSKDGTVYSIPVSRSDQESGLKLTESSWVPFSSPTANISYRKLSPKGLGTLEKVTAISGGLEHVLLLTNSGRVFSAASGSEDFPSRGQLGVPGVTWFTRPEGPYDMCHEITNLRGFEIQKLASGDTHSLVLDKEGRVFAFGDNSNGQLGLDHNSESPYVDSPSLLPITKYYQGTNQQAKVTGISAGGQNSFYSIDATRILGPSEDPAEVRTLGRTSADIWACGRGIQGTLGNGRWTHIQNGLTKIPSLSGLFEYDEKKKVVIPIRMAQMSVGSTHVSAVMDNVTYLDASEKSSENDTNWGADVVWWGGNEYYQLGTGKRNNVNTPQYIRPLDMAAEIEVGRKEEHRFHLTPQHTVNVKGRKVKMEQRVECGRNVTAVYSAV
ncbi:regulator of chromosome condensation 1/beta-lactamase-inhibitor protein II [Exophiala viscosa]|uniref:regulator of chromosome condensation 1/beta-lactamase-inhibitor protein II n=1 Tax=Exophiala viscosa TaxID=2486360 RepID=UPI00219777D8|nr:regulator of chromosome condensation 1/beta-lactamase-inhibitor protein II [Exophiala viscosa]